jgi:hypothetical protein
MSGFDEAHEAARAAFAEALPMVAQGPKQRALALSGWDTAIEWARRDGFIQQTPAAEGKALIDVLDGLTGEAADAALRALEENL